jgi:hypothetical protein
MNRNGYINGKENEYDRMEGSMKEIKDVLISRKGKKGGREG